MKTQEIVELYKTLCTDLMDTNMMTPRDFQEVTQLQLFLNDGKITEDEISQAFEMANKSDFLTGKVNGWTASIGWMCNPVNIQKVLSGKYNNNNNRSKASLKQRPQSHNHNYAEIEREQHNKNMTKLDAIRKDQEHKRWLEEYWFVKYPNLRRMQNV